MLSTFIVSTGRRSKIPSRSARETRAGLHKSRKKIVRWGQNKRVQMIRLDSECAPWSSFEKSDVRRSISTTIVQVIWHDTHKCYWIDDISIAYNHRSASVHLTGTIVGTTSVEYAVLQPLAETIIKAGYSIKAPCLRKISSWVILSGIPCGFKTAFPQRIRIS